MAFFLSLDKILCLDTEHTDRTVSSVENGENIRPIREIRVPKALNSEPPSLEETQIGKVK